MTRLRNLITIALLSGKSVLLVGAPGVGKTKLAIDVAAELTGAHPILETGRSELTYELLTCFNELREVKGHGDVLVKRLGSLGIAILGTWLRIIEGKGPLWYVLDEVNRCNIEVALGRVFTALDPEYYNIAVLPPDILDEEKLAEEDITVLANCLEVSVDRCKELMVKLRNILGSRVCGIPIPRSFRIIGTMNVVDRAHLFKIGYALSRRLIPIPVIPPYMKYDPGLDIENLIVQLYDNFHLDKNSVFTSLQEYVEALVSKEVEFLTFRFTKSLLPEYDVPCLVRIEFDEVVKLLDRLRDTSSKLIESFAGIYAVALNDLKIDLGVSILVDFISLLLARCISQNIALVSVSDEALLDLAIASLLLPQLSSLIPMLKIEQFLGSSPRTIAFRNFMKFLENNFSSSSLTYRAAEAIMYELPSISSP